MLFGWPSGLDRTASLSYLPACLPPAYFQVAECVYAIRSLGTTACERSCGIIYLWPAGSAMPSSDRMLLPWLDVARVRCNQISGGSVLCNQAQAWSPEPLEPHE